MRLFWETGLIHSNHTEVPQQTVTEESQLSIVLNKKQIARGTLRTQSSAAKRTFAYLQLLKEHLLESF